MRHERACAWHPQVQARLSGDDVLGQHKKRRLDKAGRLESVKAGREGREDAWKDRWEKKKQAGGLRNDQVLSCSASSLSLLSSSSPVAADGEGACARVLCREGVGARRRTAGAGMGMGQMRVRAKVEAFDANLRRTGQEEQALPHGAQLLQRAKEAQGGRRREKCQCAPAEKATARLWRGQARLMILVSLCTLCVRRRSWGLRREPMHARGRHPRKTSKRIDLGIHRRD